MIFHFIFRFSTGQGQNRFNFEYLKKYLSSIYKASNFLRFDLVYFGSFLMFQKCSSNDRVLPQKRIQTIDQIRRYNLLYGLVAKLNIKIKKYDPKLSG